MPDLVTVAALVRESAERWWVLVYAVAFGIGLCLIAKSFTHSAGVALHGRGRYVHAAALFLAGVSLVFIPSWYDAVFGTLYGTTSVLDYAARADDWSSAAIGIAVAVVRLVGAIGFVRGWVLLARVGKEDAASLGSTSRAFFFLIGGAAAWNIVMTSRFVLGTLGLDSPLG